MPDLLVLETDAVRLSLGTSSHPHIDESGWGGTPLHAEAVAHDVTAQIVAGASVLHEETSYALLLRSLSGEPAALRARDATLLARLTRAENGRLWHGPINFRSQVGPFRLIIEVGGEPHAALCGEVLPTKLTYRSDFEALRDAVDALAEGLALDALRATVPRAASAEPTDTTSGAAFVAQIGALLEPLDRAVEHIARAPRRMLVRVPGRWRADQVRRAEAETRRALVRQSSPTASLPVRFGQPTLATPEHAWVAQHLSDATERMTRLADALGSRSHRPQHSGLAALARRLAAVAARVPGYAPSPPPREPVAPTLCLRTAPGYREAFRALLGLRRALDLRGLGLAYSLRDLHALYETWCTLALVRTLGELTGQPATPHLEPSALGPRLRRGEGSALSFALSDTRHLVLTVQPRFRAALLPQQPDLTLDLFADDLLARRLVLDAKYRLDASDGAQRRYGLPAPPADALLTLHRYRDAVPSATHAVALYPWHTEDSYAASPLRRALFTDGVGAIPTLPNHTDALRDALVAWLTDTPS